jgi:hypothetical protein
MCGSNAAGEPLPVHVMFSSYAQEENFVVDYRWIAAMPRIQGIFGHKIVNEYCAQVTVNEKGGSDSRVLSQCLTAYQERLYPNAADVPGKIILYKIDGGPDRLDEKALAEARTRGVYLFPGVQHTTAVTQETCQNHGLFKSDVRWNIAKLTSDLVHQFTRKQGLHDQDPTSHSAPTKLVIITREHYGLIISGRAADMERDLSYLRPAFHNAFCKSKNLACWVKVGAGPCTHETLKNKNVRREVGRGDTCVPIEGFDPFKKFAYRAESMLEVEYQHKRACAHLNHLGYNVDGFLIKARRQAHNLIQHLSSITTEEALVTALARSGISLSSIFFAVGPKCLSTDEIFKAMKYKKTLEAWEQRIKERNCLIDEKLKHDAGRDAIVWLLR